MAVLNETALRTCTFLSEGSFEELYRAFLDAFSDYVFPFALTEEQFRNHIILNGVDLTRTVGCYQDGRLVGFSMNGFGEWHGRPTVYDAGTGVIPSHRRQGISDAMFDKMIPHFESAGIKQFLLEVVTSNHVAIRLYEKLGFRPTRELSLLQCDEKIKVDPSDIVELRLLDKPDWPTFLEFWKGEPSWQNSISAVDRSNERKRIVAAYVDGVCAGYVIFSSTFGRIAQIGVGEDFAGIGVGKQLVAAVQEHASPGYSLQVINAHKEISGVNEFFFSLGFYERLTQYEMLKPL